MGIINVKLQDTRCMPKRAYASDAGADLVATKDFIIPPGCMDMLDTGVSIIVPNGYAGIVCSRSGQGRVGVSLANSIGVIDSSYRGNIKLILSNNGENPHNVTAYVTKVAQLLIVPIMLAGFSVWTGSDDSWVDTARGTGGFGSTG